jgi:pimeloyl-ACP methyl ester carboxylesterase
MALYEAVLPVRGALIGSFHPARERYRVAVASNQFDEALTIAMRDMIQARPEEICALQATPMWNKMAALTPTWMREMEQLDRLESSPDRYKQLSMPTLLLVGTATAAHHQVASAALAKTLPNVRTVHLQGQGHRAHLMASGIFAKEVSNFLLQQ